MVLIGSKPQLQPIAAGRLAGALQLKEQIIDVHTCSEELWPRNLSFFYTVGWAQEKKILWRLASGLNGG